MLAVLGIDEFRRKRFGRACLSKYMKNIFTILRY